MVSSMCSIRIGRSCRLQAVIMLAVRWIIGRPKSLHGLSDFLRYLFFQRCQGWSGLCEWQLMEYCEVCFDALGADTYVINNQPNGTNINNNAGSTHIEGLQKFVVEKGLDVGFATMVMQNRCLCVDEKGNVITGDHILYIYGCYMERTW